jgi:hypothetical protein
VVSENNKPTELAKINFVGKISKAMDNLHVRPNFNLSKGNHHSCTKRNQISKTAKFGYEML